MSIVLFTQSNIANIIDKFLNSIKAKLDKLFVTILQQQQRVVLLSNYIKNSNKLDLSILFDILSFLDFENTALFKLLFDFENNTFFNSTNFNKFSEIIELLDTFQNLLFSNLDLILQKYLKLRLYRNKFADSFTLLFKIILLELYKSKTYVKTIADIYYKIDWQLAKQNKIKFLKKKNIYIVCLVSNECYVLCKK